VLIQVLITAGPALSLLVWVSVISMVIFGYLTYFMEGAMTYSVDERWLVDHPQGVYIRPTTDGTDWEVTPFRSIPDAFWYVCTTITSVGYGDFFPTTVGGRITGAVLFYVGIINLALPVTIIGTSFMLYYHDWVQEHMSHKHDSGYDADGDEGSGSNGSSQTPSATIASPSPHYSPGTPDRAGLSTSVAQCTSADAATEGSFL
jgi:hypothetical protein